MNKRRRSIYVRPEQQGERLPHCSTDTSVAGEAIAGCMVAGKTGNSKLAIPKGTFDNG